MARSGSENRQRPVTLKARFTREEAALVTGQAARAGVSVAAVIRYAVLEEKPLRASRRPHIDAALAAQLIARLGQCATALRQAAQAGSSPVHGALIEATHRDIGEMRNLLFEALELEP